MVSDPWNDAELPLAAAQKVDEICGQFERDLGNHGAPQIEMFLSDATGVYRRALLRELLALEVQYCRRRRVSVQRETLLQRFPQDGDIVDIVWEEAELACPDPAPHAANRAERGAASSTANSQTTDYLAGSSQLDSSANLLSTRIAASSAQQRYKVNCFHARGGMGEVFIADDAAIGRRVAIKQLRPERNDLRERFLAEAQVTGQLEHPGVVPLYDVGHDETGRPYYVMKFIEGCTLRSAIQDYHRLAKKSSIARDLRGVQLLQIFVQLCQTMAYAHSRGVIHRDLKPDNVMLGAFGETLVLDWGVAKSRGNTEMAREFTSTRLNLSGFQATHAGAIVGSAPYISPEAAGGDIEEVNERSDVYLLGATLYEILTGCPPRQGTSTDELLELARTAEPPPPRSLTPELPRPLQAICLKALSRRAAGRYATAQELAEDVQRYLANEPVAAFPEGVAKRAWRWCKRHRRPLGWTAVAMALVLSFAVALKKAGEVKQWRAMEQARAEVARFRSLADEVHFFAAHTEPATETTPYYDHRHALRLAELAFDTASAWGSTLERLPLVDEREPLRDELYDLSLLMIQSQISTATPANSSQPLRPWFERAAQLRQPTRAYYQLLREASITLPSHVPTGTTATANVRTTAFDHFIAGERLRQSALVTSLPDEGRPASANRTNLDAALQEYDRALALDSRHYWTHFQRARCFLALGRNAEAIEAFGSCIALRPEAPWGYSSRGLAAALNQQFDEALRDLDRVVSSHPDFSVARLNRGVAYWQMGATKHLAALADFTAVLAAPPPRRLVEAAFYRAQLELEHGDWKSALADLDLVIAERAQFRTAYKLRAQLRLKHESVELGVHDLNTFLALSADPTWDTDSGLASFARGRFLRRFANDANERALMLAEAAELELRRALEKGQEGAMLFEELGATVELTGKYLEASELYTRGLQNDPNHLGLHRKRGWLLAQHLHNFTDATKDFEIAHAAEPHDPEAIAGLGYVAACQNLPEAAEKYAVQAVLYGGGDYLTLHNVACIYARLFRNSQQLRNVYKSLGLQMLDRDVELWRRGGAGRPHALQAIAGDAELRVLDFRSVTHEAN